MIDTIATQTASPTAAVCESMALYGASPERGELDSRVVWDEDDAIDALTEAIRVIVDGITVEGTQMADEREALLWGFANCLHSQVTRLDRTVDRITPEMRDLERAQDGTEVKAWELETLTDRARNLGDRRDAFEKMRDVAADAYRVHTGDVWRPRHGSHASQTGTAHLGRHRRARLQPRAQGPRDPRPPAERHPGGDHRRQDRRRCGRHLGHARPGEGQVRRHGAAARRRPRRREDRRELGRGARRQPGDLPPRLERARQGRPLPAQRRAAEPAAQGRHRVPRLSGITGNLVDKARQLGIPVMRISQ